MKKILICSYYFGDELFRKMENHDREDLLIPFYELKAQLSNYGFEVTTVENLDPREAELIIFTEAMPKEGTRQYSFFQYCIQHDLKEKMRLFLIESPMVTPQPWNREAHKVFEKVFTWNDDWVDNELYYKTNYYQPILESESLIPFGERKLCTMISSNKMEYQPLELYSERIAAVRAFERLCPYQFDLYGSGWNQPRYNRIVERLNPFLVEKFSSYRGPVKSKIEVLSKYKYAICFENMLGVPGYSGYITEKIFHCLMARCVPIYLGANNITNYVPEDVFIDRRKFNSYDELFAYIYSISETDYMHYLHNIEKYLESSLFKDNFSVDSFVKSVLLDLEENEGR